MKRFILPRNLLEHPAEKEMKTIYFKKSLVTKFLCFCVASCLETFVDDAWRRHSAGIDDQSALSSLASIINQSCTITQQSCAGLAVTCSFSVKLFAWKLLCTSTASFRGALFQINLKPAAPYNINLQQSHLSYGAILQPLLIYTTSNSSASISALTRIFHMIIDKLALSEHVAENGINMWPKMVPCCHKSTLMQISPKGYNFRCAWSQDRTPTLRISEFPLLILLWTPELRCETNR